MSSIIPGYEYDIFISYRQKDNKYDGWVTEFVDNLKRELDSMFKDDVTVYFDINPSDYLLESHDVNESLKEKLKCLVFIPIISRTYCDPKAFAWEHEFKAFIEEASHDHFGLKIKLPGGNVANRVLPIRIHDLDNADIKLFESEVGGVMRSIDFVYKETGVNRQLRAKDDDLIRNPGQILYRDQINKVALAVRDIIESMKLPVSTEQERKKESKAKEPSEEELTIPKPESPVKKAQPEKEKRIHLLRKPGILIPLILGIVTVLGLSIYLLYHHSKVKWAKEKALPEIEQYANDFNMSAAFNLIHKSEKYLSKDPGFQEMSSWVVKKLTVITDPPDADVYVRDYSDLEGEWEKLGTTPIDSMKVPNFTFYRVKIEKTGYDDVHAVASTMADTLFRKLFKMGEIPQDMVYVDGYWDEVEDVFKKENGFFIDRYEVTNKQYKEFVDRGGYRNQEYWKNEFIRNGKKLSWEEAMSGFIDKTGRPGPSTWEAGDFPTGQDDYPVSGLSWYEAAAYAEFAGKVLPTGDHWDSGAGFHVSSMYTYFGVKLYPLSNLNGKGPEPVGKNQGMTSFGAYDMAGNVREWCWNETGIGRIISGAAYDDVSYQYTTWSQLPPFDRSPQNGFRCARYIEKEKIPESAFRRIDFGFPERDYSHEVPVSDDIFNVYKNQFRYDSTALDAVIEERDEEHNNWIVEKITFNAAYENDRMIAYLYLPKNSSPPYQTLVFYPGSYAVTEKDLKSSRNSTWFIDYVLKSGRAVIYPVYFRTYERNDGQTMHWRSQSHQYTEILIRWVKDFSRSIDYLETRPDIDETKIGFYGHSWGGILGGIIPAVEERLKVNILIVGGFGGGRALPEADGINYVSRIKIPTLMLNGKYDTRFPYHTDVMPFFDHLGTPASDKRLCVYDTEHYVSKSDMIKEVLSWLDKYFGPVNYLQNK